MIRLISLLLAAACGASAGNVVLLIGIGKYKKEILDLGGGRQMRTSLPGIDLDIAMMHKTALALGFKASEIRTLFNEQAGLDSIRAALRDVASSVKAKDRVLIYYSGHGAQVKDQDGDEPDGKDEVIVPWDFDSSPEGMVNVLVDDEMAQLLAAIPAENTLLILDSCNSGTADRSFSTGAKAVGPDGQDDFRLKMLPAEIPGVPASKGAGDQVKPPGAFTGSTDRYVAIMAAQEDEFAGATKSGSVLTKALAEAVNSYARSHSPISAQGLHQLAAAEAERHCQQVLATGNPCKQHPQLRGNPAKKGISLRIVDDRFSMVSEWADSVPAKLDFSADKSSVKNEEVIAITLRNVPRSGYLNLVQVGSITNEPRVLFPNKYFKGSNRVEKGQTISLPSPDQQFEFYAKTPAGAASERVVLVAILTEQPRDLSASSDDLNSSFRKLSTGNEKDFEVRPRQADGAAEEAIYAGKIVVEVRQ